jgi:hypothetical protein
MKAEKYAREWETFEGGQYEPLSTRRHITLNLRRIFLINKNVFNELGQPEAVMLMYDRKNQTIGMRAAVDGDVRPFPVAPHPKGSHYHIHAAKFCRHYGIELKRHIRFAEPWFDTNGILVLQLNYTEPVVGRDRRSKVAEV